MLSWVIGDRASGAAVGQSDQRLLTVDQLHRVLARERARADRNGHHFSLIVFDLPGGHSCQALLAGSLFARLRCSDDIGWFDEGRLAAVLPDTPLEGAWHVAGEIRRLTAARVPDLACAAYTYPPAWWQRFTDADRRPPDDPSGNGHRPEPARRAKARRVRSRDDRRGTGPPPAARRAIAFVERDADDELGRRLGRPLPIWKRAVDVVGAATAFVLLAPIIVVTTVLVRVTSPGPAIFRQLRVGKDGTLFTFYKFRTMYLDADEQKKALQTLNEQTWPVFKMKDDPRVTPLGRFLRRTSIDELPQLWNVLKGDMSLVGPRPPTIDEVARYERWHHRRLGLTPGLTGIWQVSGRSLVGFTDWVRMDIAYAERRSWLLDLEILARTIPAVLSGRGAH